MIIQKVSLYIIIINVFFISQNNCADIITTPYLQGVTDSSVYVVTESFNTKNVRVLFREANSGNEFKEVYPKMIVNTTQEPPTQVNKILLTGLKERTLYEYQLKNGKSIEVFTGRFKTAPKKGDNFRFAVFGDMRSNPLLHSSISEAVMKSEPDFAVLLGDLCYKPDYNYWKDEFFVDEFLELSRNVPFVNAVGNHEDWSHNTKAFLQGPVIDEEDKGYYAFNYGDILFLILNTEVSISKNSSQWKFAEKILKDSDKKYKIVASHIPAYSSGGQGENKVMKAITSELFEKYGVDIVMNGHSHFYQRNYVNGIYHLILAGGGAPLYTPKPADYVQKSVKIHHFSIFDYTNGILKMKVIDKKGNEIDSMEFKK